MASQETLRTVGVYDKTAEAYAQKAASLDPGKDLVHFTRHLGHSAVILDAGCGFGRELATFGERGDLAIGVDLSLNMLRQAVKKDPKNIVIRSEVCGLPFQDETFDGVWCRGVLHHIPDVEVEKTLTELTRVLKVGGTIFLMARDGEGHKWEQDDLVAGKSRFINFFSTDRLQELMIKSGLTVLETYIYNEWMRYRFGRANANFAVAVGQKQSRLGLRQ